MTDLTWPWPAGAATGIGSLPGVDITEAQRVVLGELPDLPHLAELPARGPGAELVGRSAGLLVDLPVELYAGRWRLAAHTGRDLRRTRDIWDRDLDELTALASAYPGSLKVQAAGPWTLAATLALPVGGVVLRDHGATRDLADSLAEGLRRHLADLRARIPGARLLLQLDEPALPAVLAARVPTESGLGTLRAVAVNRAAEALRAVIEAAGVPVIVHCCAADPPLGMLRETGAAAVALDLDNVGALDPLGEALDAGWGLFAGVVSTAAGDGSTVSIGSANAAAPISGPAADRVRRLWRDLGLPAERLSRQVVVTPACGLADAAPEQARATMSACRDAAYQLWHNPEA